MTAALLRWYVTITEPSRDRFAANWLMRDGVTTFVAECKETVIQRGTKYVRRALMFPRYIFTHLLDDDTQFGPVNRTPGVHKMLSNEGFPVALPDAIVEELRARMAAEDGAISLDRPFFFHEELRIKATGEDDKLSGLTGLYLHTARDRVALLMQWCGGSRITSVPSSSVERVTA